MKKRFLISLLIIILSVLAPFPFILHLDALNLFKLSGYFQPGFANQRLLFPGIIKYAEYDIAVVGSSTAHVISSEYIENKFQKKCINVSLTKASAFEETEFLRLIAERKKDCMVILSLDFASLQTAPEYSMVPLDDYIYHENLIDLLPSVLSYRSIKNNILAMGVEENVNPKDVHNHSFMPNSLDSKRVSPEEFMNRPTIQNDRIYSILCDMYSPEPMEYHIQRMMKLAQDNPHLDLHIYFPPYSYLWWNLAIKEGKLETIIALKKYVVASATSQKNVTIHDFQNEKEITTDLRQYEDLIHFSDYAARFIVDSIMHATHQVESENQIIVPRIEEPQADFSHLKYSIIH